MDAAKYTALFLSESREHLAACNRALLAWERGEDRGEAVAALFRAVHTIKGMAATMGFGAIAEVSHELETLLAGVREGTVVLAAGALEGLFEGVDALEAAVDAIAGGAPVPDLTGLKARLAAAAAGAAAPAATAEVPVVAPAAPGPAAQPVRRVRVAVRAGAMMRGARALIALGRAERLGTVRALEPPRTVFDREDFDGRFQFTLESPVADDAVEAALLGAGELERVEVTPAEAVVAAGPSGVRHVRVDLRRLDTLVKEAGELVVATNRLLALTRRSGGAELADVAERIGRLVDSMQEDVLAARMAPVEEVFDRFPRLVRDVARELGKEVRFEQAGGEIELDRSVLDQVGDPLVHLLRNAIDHGLEAPAERVARGKPREGRLTVTALREQSSVALRVSDDGRGIDRARVLDKARAAGMVEPGVTALSDAQLLKVIARPGFSTAAQVSGVSGRGVGVDVVATRLRTLGGTVEVTSVEGQGTTFTLRVPLTLAIVRVMLAGVGGERYALPIAYVAETVAFDERQVTALGARQALVLRDAVLPTVHLGTLLQVPAAPAGPRSPTIVVQVGERRSAVVVDALLGQQDIVVEPFDAPAGMPPLFGGATILADGAPALILDAAALV